MRYILNDHLELSQKARNIVDNNDIEITIETLCEVVFVLKSVYDIERKIISEKINLFFEKTQCILPHKDAVLRGLAYYANTKLDFVDCILAGYAEIESALIETFDKDLKKLLNKITMPPFKKP